VIASAADPRGIEADAHIAKPYEAGELCRVVAEMSLRAMAA
jgi:hypothetical protein